MDRLSAFIADVFGVIREDVSAQTGPGTIPQWDSLGHMHLVAAIEETYQVQFSMEEITSLMSVERIAAVLRDKGVQDV